MRNIWIPVGAAIVAALVGGASNAMAEGGAEVVLRDGTELSCDRFAAARNYSLCFVEGDRLVTVNHAELWKVDMESSDSSNDRLVWVR